jgi:hypothetical protein
MHIKTTGRQQACDLLTHDSATQYIDVHSDTASLGDEFFI